MDRSHRGSVELGSKQHAGSSGQVLPERKAVTTASNIDELMTI